MVIELSSVKRQEILTVLDTVLRTWTPDKFTTRTLARDKYNRVRDYASLDACTWCVGGALLNSGANSYTGDAIWSVLENSCRALFEETVTIMSVNDNMGYAAARSVLEHAYNVLSTSTELINE